MAEVTVKRTGFTDVQKDEFRTETGHKKEYKLTFADSALAYDGSNISEDGIEITESLCSADNLSFSSVEIPTLSFTLINIDQNIKDLKEKKFSMEVTVSGVVTVPMGTWTITEATRNNDDLMEVKAEGQIRAFAKDVTTWWTSIVTVPITLRDLLISLCDYVGVDYSIPEKFTNSDMVITKKGVTGSGEAITGIDMLGYIQEAAAHFFSMPRLYNNGTVLTIVEFDALYPSETLYPSKTLYPARGPAKETYTGSVFTGDVDIADYTTAAIERVQIKGSADDVGAIVGTGSNTYIIESNPLFFIFGAEDLEKYATNILAQVKTLTYVPVTANVKGLPYLIPGDKINIHTPEGHKVETRLLCRTLSGAQDYSDVVTIKGDKDREKVTTQNKTLKVVNRRIHELINNVDILSSTISNVQEEVKGNTDKITENSTKIEQTATDISTVAKSVETVSEKVEKDSDRITSNENGLSAADDKITELTTKTTENETSIKQNAESIEANAKSVETIKTGLTEANTKISENSSAITQNANQISSVVKSVETVSSKTDSNTKAIEANSAAISSANTKISENSSAITQNANSIKSVVSSVEKVSSSVDSANDAISRNAEAISTNTSKIEQTANRINLVVSQQGYSNLLLNSNFTNPENYLKYWTAQSPITTEYVADSDFPGGYALKIIKTSESSSQTVVYQDIKYDANINGKFINLYLCAKIVDPGTLGNKLVVGFYILYEDGTHNYHIVNTSVQTIGKLYYFKFYHQVTADKKVTLIAPRIFIPDADKTQTIEINNVMLFVSSEQTPAPYGTWTDKNNNDLISQINLAPEGVKISGDKVNIETAQFTFGKDPSTVTMKTNGDGTGVTFEGSGTVGFNTKGSYRAVNVNANSGETGSLLTMYNSGSNNSLYIENYKESRLGNQIVLKSNDSSFGNFLQLTNYNYANSNMANTILWYSNTENFNAFYLENYKADGTGKANQLLMSSNISKGKNTLTLKNFQFSNSSVVNGMIEINDNVTIKAQNWLSFYACGGDRRVVFKGLQKFEVNGVDILAKLNIAAQGAQTM